MHSYQILQDSYDESRWSYIATGVSEKGTQTYIKIWRTPLSGSNHSMEPSYLFRLSIFLVISVILTVTVATAFVQDAKTKSNLITHTIIQWVNVR
jgi:hypothetical protein